VKRNIILLRKKDLRDCGTFQRIKSEWLVGDTIAYGVKDGLIVTIPSRGNIGNLYAEKEYSDFNFRFEFQLTPAANNGVGIRAPLTGDAAYVGMELQILDDTSPDMQLCNHISIMDPYMV